MIVAVVVAALMVAVLNECRNFQLMMTFDELMIVVVVVGSAVVAVVMMMTTLYTEKINRIFAAFVTVNVAVVVMVLLVMLQTLMITIPLLVLSLMVTIQNYDRRYFPF